MASIRCFYNRHPLFSCGKRAIALFSLLCSSPPAVAQSISDILRGSLGQALNGQNMKGLLQGWITDKLTQVLTKSAGAMSGDKRLANGGKGLALTPGEQSRANTASSLFEQVQTSAAGQTVQMPVYLPGKPGSKAMLARLQRYRQLFNSHSPLPSQYETEYRQALRPFLLTYLVKKGLADGVGAAIIPPHSIQSFKFAAYCSDPHLPAPQRGEQFQLVPTETLYPPSLQPALRGLLRIGAQQGHGHDNAIQGLIWTIRRVASGESMGQSLTLSPEQQRLLLQADPHSLTVLQNYYQQGQGQKMMQDAIKSGVQRITGSMGSALNVNPISNSQALSEIANLGRQIEASQPTGSVHGQNAAYSLLTPNVAALATTQTGGYGTVDIDIANNSNQPFVFTPGSFVAQSTRPAQRLVMHSTQLVLDAEGSTSSDISFNESEREMSWPPN